MVRKSKEQLVLSIDIGGTFTKIGLVDRFGKILGKGKIDTAGFQTEKEFISAVFRTFKYLESKLDNDFCLTGVGIGSPGVSTQSGVIVRASNIPFLKEVNLIEKLGRQFGVSVFMLKDSNLAALGEGAFGAAKGMKNYILLTLGTGLGCAVVVNGSLLQGNTGLAGEFGHSLISETGRECGCGRIGCLETYVSATGVVRTAIELLAHTRADSVLRDYSVRKITTEIIFKAASRGDVIARLVFDKTGFYLGKQLANLFTLFDPEAVILSGGLVGAGELLLKPVIQNLESNLLYSINVKNRVRVSALGANDAALLGAAHLVFKHKKEILI